jgi:hypothetical protein
MSSSTSPTGLWKKTHYTVDSRYLEFDGTMEKIW